LKPPSLAHIKSLTPKISSFHDCSFNKLISCPLFVCTGPKTSPYTHACNVFCFFKKGLAYSWLILESENFLLAGKTARQYLLKGSISEVASDNIAAITLALTTE
jgi:hypothetical protein